jgi:hypothetical protein
MKWRDAKALNGIATSVRDTLPLIAFSGTVVAARRFRSAQSAPLINVSVWSPRSGPENMMLTMLPDPCGVTLTLPWTRDALRASSVASTAAEGDAVCAHAYGGAATVKITPARMAIFQRFI